MQDALEGLFEATKCIEQDKEKAGLHLEILVTGIGMSSYPNIRILIYTK